MMERLLTLLQSEAALSVIKYGFGGVGCTLLGAWINSWNTNRKDRLQKMDCFYIEDDVLAKIPGVYDNNTMRENIHCKRFKVINTTNKDIGEFKIIFQFDATAEILDCYSQSKEGYDCQKIRPNSQNKNEAEAIVRHFNRGDAIEYVFRIANISANDYYVTESKCMGFKIVCKDKRKDTNKSKSKRSDQILITKH